MKLNLDMEAHGRVMEDRVNVMREMCHKYEDEAHNPKRVASDKVLLWDLKHHLVYCPIYKVASGTWTTNFLRLSGFNSDLPKWQRFSKLHNASEGVSRKMFPPPKGKKKQEKELNRSTKFLVVRHPFDRIISAYKGKISRPDAKPRRYRQLQKEIKKKYSHNEEEIANQTPPSFEEYWRYLTDLTSSISRPGDWRAVDCVRAFYSVCAPCDVNYDVILKLETHDEDTEYLIRKYGLTELSEPFNMWKHNSKGANQIGDYEYYVYDDPSRNPLNLSIPEKTAASEHGEESLDSQGDLVDQMEADKGLVVDEREMYKRQLFGQLSKRQIKNLYNNYIIDFDMFGYDIEKFLSYAKR